jgi:hypothetical protein
VALPTSIPDEISEFLHRNADRIRHLPQIINIAFSGERKPAAWHVRLINKQVSRGFNKAAPVTIMLPLKSWRFLMKKNKIELWQKALADGQIHIHGDPTATQSVLKLFQANGNLNTETPEEESDVLQDAEQTNTNSTNGKAKSGQQAKARRKKSSSVKQKKTTATRVKAE